MFQENGEKVPLPRIAAVLAIDLDISKFDINQCDGQGEYSEIKLNGRMVSQIIYAPYESLK